MELLLSTSRPFIVFTLFSLNHSPSPSSLHTVQAFSERTRIERGQYPAPRIFHTGETIFGAHWHNMYNEIVDMDEAVEALGRLKAEGGDIAISYKNYNLPSR
jgi:hypothetical protein